jgi:hypothetical protein
VKFISPEDKSLQVQVVERKVDTTATPKVDKDLERAMERIASIANSDMDNQEKVRVLRSMVIEAQRQELDLQSAIGELKKSLPTKGK